MAKKGSASGSKRSARAAAGGGEAAPPTPPKPGRPSALVDTRVIYCGDNLEQLKKLPDGCVDLIYIDPPFNSNRNYEVFWGETKEKRSFEDRHASTQAYIDYMRPRCVELARVLKKTGSFYYHCDWHASHYVKVMLDQIFGENNFQNEIIWKRTFAHSSAKRYGPVHDSIFYYVASPSYIWNKVMQPYDAEYLDVFFDQKDENGRRWMRMDLTGDGVRRGESGKPWRGIDVTAKGRHWAIPGEAAEMYNLIGRTVQEKLDELDRWGAIHWPEKEGGVPRYKRYADRAPGVPLQTIWTDIRPIHNLSKERLGYPTQKPLALLERIIKTSSNPNDIVLDAFCGCGTALVAAQNLGRQWIGIDISPTACRVMAKRLKDVCGMRESEPGHRKGDAGSFVVRDLPWTIAKLKEIPPFEFENWAVIALGGVPNKVQVGDMGIDGRPVIRFLHC
ncbi:DNA methyltransferase [Leptolyngbya sp. 7M]|uniref:DNA methyltransferase n=1 Tax=Leptolyngbya sp. 7M TaxID=2812896 RepID=UPI001B8B5B7E|nr:site-specific DNA-methyltransferase [Leptolyngbya sp. 7M]QYO64305.1 site-specific DNA-methyltransferase [Leptolyngbya sp. 7M]